MGRRVYVTILSGFWLAFWLVVREFMDGVGHHMSHMWLGYREALPTVTQWLAVPVIWIEPLSTGQAALGVALWGLLLGWPTVMIGAAWILKDDDRMYRLFVYSALAYGSAVVALVTLVFLSLIAPSLYL